MGIFSYLARIGISAAIIVMVAEISKRSPRLGALLLSLPLVSVLAFTMSWLQHRDLPAVSRMARETLVLVPLGLPFFVPLAFASKLGWDFWPAIVVGVLLAALTIGSWLFFVPSN